MPLVCSILAFKLILIGYLGSSGCASKESSEEPGPLAPIVMERLANSSSEIMKDASDYRIDDGPVTSPAIYRGGEVGGWSWILVTADGRDFSGDKSFSMISIPVSNSAGGIDREFRTTRCREALERSKDGARLLVASVGDRIIKGQLRPGTPLEEVSRMFGPILVVESGQSGFAYSGSIRVGELGGGVLFLYLSFGRQLDERAEAAKLRSIRLEYISWSEKRTDLNSQK